MKSYVRFMKGIPLCSTLNDGVLESLFLASKHKTLRKGNVFMWTMWLCMCVCIIHLCIFNICLCRCDNNPTRWNMWACVHNTSWWVWSSQKNWNCIIWRERKYTHIYIAHGYTHTHTCTYIRTCTNAPIQLSHAGTHTYSIPKENLWFGILTKKK